MPSISVIIPVYGTERFIARCLDSVLTQSFQDYEIIIVNDCTKDNAMVTVEEYAQRHNNIRIVEHTSNQGLMVARKSGYTAAAGNYIVFLDSDDTLPENALETLYDEIVISDVKIVSGGYRYIYDIGTSVDRHPVSTGLYKAKDAIEFCLQGKMNHNLAFAIFDKSLFEKEYLTIPSQTNGEDLILFYQLVKEAGAIKIIPNIVYDYYQNFASSSNSAVNISKIRQWAKAQNFKYEFCSGINVDKDILMGNIIKIIAPWPAVKNGKDIYKELNKDIQSHINIASYFRYLSIFKAIYFTLLRHIPSLAFILRLRRS